MEKKVPQREHFEQDEFSLRDLWRILISQRRWLLGIPIFCMLLATIGVIIAKPKWEAAAVIQIGQVGQSGVGQGSQLIELRSEERRVGKECA